MQSTIRLLGHSGLDIRMGATRVVCDPWLSRRGAYLETWYPFPDNTAVRAEELHDAPVVVVTSPRPDHFDRETLQAFPKNARLVVPAFPSRTLADGLRGLGFGEVVELADWQAFDLGGGATLKFVTGSIKQICAATLIVEVGGDVLVDQNDCVLDEAALGRLAASKPLFHFLQTSGVTYAPIFHDLGPAEMQAHVGPAKAGRVARFFHAAQTVGARYVVPLSAPWVLDDERFALNFGDGIHIDAEEIVARAAVEAPALVDRLRLLYPGDVASANGADWQLDSHKPYDDKRRYLEALRRDREPERAQGLADLRAQAEPVDIKDVRAYLRDFFQFEDMTYNMEILVQFQLVDGPSVWVDFRKRPVRYLTECDEAASSVLTLEPDFMSLVLQEKVSFHELLMGHRMTLRPQPGQDCPPLMNHLDYRHDEALFDLVRRLDPALITVQDEDTEYVCQRFCPHRGRDLEYAVIERGKLTCTAHGWRFDLRNGGKCLWGGDAPLLVKEIRPLKGAG